MDLEFNIFCIAYLEIVENGAELLTEKAHPFFPIAGVAAGDHLIIDDVERRLATRANRVPRAGTVGLVLPVKRSLQLQSAVGGW